MDSGNEIITDTEMTTQIEPQVPVNHYYNYEYDSMERFISYWHQIAELRVFKSKLILEIGIGNGFVANYLNDRGFQISTLDIDKNLKPDVCGSIIDIPFKDEAFHVVACFEVLEHLPFKNINNALCEIYRVTTDYAILSLPDCNRAYRLDIQLPKFGSHKLLIPIPRLKPLIHSFDGEHYWEIGKSGYSIQVIKDEIEKTGWFIDRTYRVFEVPYHRFFILSKMHK